MQSKRGLFRNADMMLDTLTLTTGTGSVIALSSAIPILTIAGESLHSRTCLSLLDGINMHELVADGVDEYKAKAIRLASDRNYYDQIKQQIEQNMNSHPPLFNREQYIVDMQNLFIDMINEKLRTI